MTNLIETSAVIKFCTVHNFISFQRIFSRRRFQSSQRKTLSDNRKTRNQEHEKSEEGSELYGTPNNESESPRSEKTEAKTKQGESYQD